MPDIYILLMAPLVLLVLFVISLFIVPNIFAERLTKIRKILPTDPKLGHKLKTPEGEKLSYETVTVVGKGGVRLHCWLLWDDDAKSNGETILLFHGLQMSKRLFLPIATEFCRRGFQVFMPDLRAHGESEGSFTTYGFEEKFDVVNMIDWLAVHKGVTRVGLVGISLGGIIGMQAAAIESRIRVMAIQSPYTSLDSVVKNAGRKVSPMLVPMYHSTLRNLVKKRIGVDIRQVDMISAAMQLHIPVMFIAGANDTEVPVQETREVYEVATGTKLLFEVAGAHHGNIHKVAGPAYWDQISSFFLSHLSAPRG
jgi:uncharacterized protein